MKDILERLSEPVDPNSSSAFSECRLKMAEAAEEVKKLREERDDLRLIIKRMIT